MKSITTLFYIGTTFIVFLDFDQVEGDDEGNGTTNGNRTDAVAESLPMSKDEFKGPAAWIRICQPGGKYVGAVSTGKDDCPAGYWFKDPIKVGCVCGHGVWIFARGWCDHTARIIVAKDGSCFNINKDVKYIKQIGWYKNAFMPYHFVGTTGMEYIQSVPQVVTMSNKATHFHPDYHQHIGAIFRERGIESMSGRFCLSHKGNQSRPLSFKYFVPKLPFFEKRQCFAYPNQDLSRTEYDAGYNLYDGLTLTDDMIKPFNKPPSWVLDADSNKCSTECPSAKALFLNTRQSNSFAPDYVDPVFDEYFQEELKEMGWKATANQSLPEEIPELQRSVDREYVLSNRTMVELQEQTKRMIRLNLKSSIKNEASPRVKYADYRLLQKARTIINKVCPETDLPTTVLIGMHRMFRIAVNESFFHYPFHQPGDMSDTSKIGDILATCLKDSRPMTFKYANTTGDKCAEGKFLGVNYEFKTNTTSLNRTIMAKLPVSLRSNVTELDLVVETAWKTVMFTHYYCARHFKENSLGFSIFEQKMERFFNRWIQHRWFYPGLAFQGYKYIYQMFNLDKFGKALDRCVAAARSFSLYRKWIRRPTYSKFIGGRLFEEQYEIPDDIAGRSKLDAINPLLNQFNKTAYCLPYWHAPASNPGLNYDPAGDYKAGCVKYVTEEWVDPFTPLFGKHTGWRDTLEIF